MVRPLAVAAVASVAVMCGCSPTLDWREVRVEPTGLRAMFPCKPETDSHQVTLVGRDIKLQALVCRAGSNTFAILSGDIGGPAAAAAVLREWKAASLARLRSENAHESRFSLPGAFELNESAQVIASGKRPDGSKVESRAAYFAHGPYVFQAVIYTGTLAPESADPFFGGLRFE